MTISRLLAAALASAALTAPVAVADTGTPATHERAEVRPAARSTATPSPTPADVTAAALARERAYESYGRPATRDADALALAQERYYSSYGRPASPSQPRSDDAPPLPIALVSMIGLITLATGLTCFRRIQSRRRATHVAA
jgi:hypothetical protein